MSCPQADSRQAVGERRPQLVHRPGLDGLRGIAVLAVLLYHGGTSWAGGGFLGVEVFFVLSGFLITALLLTEWLDGGAIELGRFWARRARRLFPALLLVLAAIAGYYTAGGPGKAVPGFLDDGLAAIFYASNWHQIAVGSGYFVQTGPVSPFQHTWSLSIEEQFYLVWPVLLIALAWLCARRVERSTDDVLSTLLVLVIAGLLASGLEAALLFDAGRGLERVYYGTDTRAMGLLAGAALAAGVAIRHRRGRDRLDWPAERALWAASALGLGGIVIAIQQANGGSAWLYPYGLVAVDLGSVLVIAALVMCPRSPVARLLSVRPLRALGLVSYGVYLWHWPLFLWLDSASTGVSGLPLLVLRLAVTLLISVISYGLIEQPVRQRRLPVPLVSWLAPAAAGVIAWLVVAASASSLPEGVPAKAALPPPPPGLKGGDPPCSVSLTDTPSVGLAAVPPAREMSFEQSALQTDSGQYAMTWRGSARRTFTTCPPKRVMLIGDSVAFTLGVPILADEEQYGVELANAALLGCAFTTRGQLNVNGEWQRPAAGCADALGHWAAEERWFRPQVIVVELGYRDEFNWRWGGRVVHLGEPAFDAYLQRQINDYVRVFVKPGTLLLFLTVPYTDPPELPNGLPAPAASVARHTEMNAMLRAAAGTDPRHVSVLNVDDIVSPGNRYATNVDGQVCRFGGVHFTAFCGELVGRAVLIVARELMAAGSSKPKGSDGLARTGRRRSRRGP